MRSKGRNSRTHSVYPSIDAWLRANNVSVMELARRVEISQQSMSLLMNGRTLPRKRTIDKILRITGMTYEEAFGDPRKESGT